MEVRERLRFNFIPEDIARYEYWWVRPVGKAGNEGTPSVPLQCPGVDVPRNDQSAAIASWDAGAGTLSWYYYHLGDFNCDGWVTAVDISQIGQNFLQENTGDPNTVAGVMDTDDSGFVDQGDLDDFESYVNSCIVGYNVYIADGSWGYPDSNGARSRLVPYASVDFMYVEFPDEPYRPLLSLAIPDIAPGSYIWVRPYDPYGYEGTPSNLAEVE